MKIAILGSRGIPVGYGGFETLAEELSLRLAKKGHDVCVYCSRPYTLGNDNIFKGVKRVILPGLKGSTIEKPLYVFVSLLHVLFTKSEVVLMLGVSVSVLCFFPRIFGKKVVVHIDGLEWKRRKWGRLASWYLKFSERMAGITSDAVLTDSMFIQEYYKNTYGKETVYIPYGAAVDDAVPDDFLKDFSLFSGGYVLQACRLEPENNVDLVIEGYVKSKMLLPLVVLGDAPEGSEYKKKLLTIAGGKVRFLGSVYGPAYKQIVAHSALYIHAHEVGGTNPSLLEAMAVGIAPLYLDVPFNREVVGEVGFPFEKDPASLSALLDDMAGKGDEVKGRAGRAQEIIRERYSWGSVVDSYEKLFLGLIAVK